MNQKSKIAHRPPRSLPSDHKRRENTPASFLLFFLAFLSLSACRTWQAAPYDFPKPADTSDQPVAMPEQKTWQAGSVFADNRFPAARLSDFRQEDDSTFRASILPENTPVNPSPWYAFRLWAEQEQDIRLVLDYTHARHRYFPKVSRDGKTWEALDSSRFSMLDTEDALLALRLSPDTLWLAAQAPAGARQVGQWCARQSLHPAVQWETIGRSRLGRALWMLDIGEGKPRKKPLIVLLCRQHPPEVTGWEALKFFVDEILADDETARAFRQQYRVLVFPLLNPDGADLGFWRHNAGGVDLNRDWAYYRQPEPRQVADRIVREAGRNHSDVLIGLDFHSTYKDVFYTNDETETPPSLPGFKDRWLSELRAGLPEFEFKESPSNVGAPVTKGWFLTQFGAVGMTYEIGDDTPPEAIEQKGRASARVMMRLLKKER